MQLWLLGQLCPHCALPGLFIGKTFLVAPASQSSGCMRAPEQQSRPCIPYWDRLFVAAANWELCIVRLAVTITAISLRKA
jgi:hypothetical protein